MTARHSAGGAAAASGMDFQHRVAAWIAVRILAEQNASPLGLPASSTLEFLRCETEQPVDDILVGTSDAGFAFIQVKKTLQLSRDFDSDFASALDQFVRQFILCRDQTSGSRPWERPIDISRDGLVIITGPASSTPVRVHLPNVLDRIRRLAPGQPIGDAALNNQEQRALKVAVGHIRTAWQRAIDTPPSEDELKQVLSLIHVQVLDVEDGGSAQREANELLQSAILRDPDQADAAWVVLLTLCAELAAQRSGAARPGLQHALLDAGIAIQVARSYRDDIERLMAYSRTTAFLVSDLALIRVGQTEVKIHRRSTEELRRMAEEGSLLVVGEPGAGKSGALHDLVQVLEGEGRDVVFLAVDRLAARSLGEIREELDLGRELIEILANWPGKEPAFVVIDALDAARADPAGTAVRDLIRMVIGGASRWSVVASIRKFDLRYSPELKHLFSGEPSQEFLDAEFMRIRHLNVPPLADAELAQIPTQSPVLQAMVTGAPAALRDLLRVPFNLRLVAELVGAGLDPSLLTPIHTQLELLDRYWSYRVFRSDGQGDTREDVLRRACEAMVRGRALRVDRQSVADPASGLALTDLLSSHVLAEWQPSPAAAPDRYVLTFSHNVLFDYAVARLLLRGTASTLIDRLAGDTELVLVIRPSLLLHFRHLWTVDCHHDQFWDLVFRIMRVDAIPEIGKLIGPSVGAELARQLSDLEPLCNSIECTDATTQSAAEQALLHLVGSLLAALPDETRLAGPGAGPWCDLLERVSRNLRARVAYIVRSLLSTLCDHPESFTSEQRAAAGKTARHLLEFAWSHIPRERWLVIAALESVSRTFESDPSASALLLRRCLEPPHLIEYGFEEMPRLAHEVKRLIPHDSALVEEIYRAAFSHKETSREPTSLGESRILRMGSNRGQDYDMALYVLAEAFPDFLTYDPKRATNALIAVMEGYVADEHAPASGEVIEEPFEFDGCQASIRTDYSAIWDESGASRYHEPIKMLDAFDRYLTSLAERDEEAAVLLDLVEFLVKQNRLAVLWRRLLLLGARFPATLGLLIRPLAWAMPILTSYDTSIVVGDFIHAVFPLLNSTERKRVESAILSIAENASADRQEAAEHIRNRLLGCLSLDLATEEVRSLLGQLRERNAIPVNQPPSLGWSWSGPYGEEEHLADQGVLVQAEPNIRIRDLEQPVKEYADKHMNSLPAQEEMGTVLPALQALRTALSRAEGDGVHPKQQEYAWGHLAAACACIAKADDLSCEGAVGALARTVLLEASHHSDPVHHPDGDARFDEQPSWGSPAARIEAAGGLITLARHSTCATDEVLGAVERLSSDPVPAVRFQIASRLNALYRTAPELMWRIVERMCRAERNRGVLQGLLSGPLDRLASAHTDRIASLTKEILDRVSEGPGAKEVREFCISILAGLYIWRDQALCREIIFGIVRDLAANFNEADHVLNHLRAPLIHGPIYPPDPNQDAVRLRAFDLITHLLRSAREGLGQLEVAHGDTPFNAWPEPDQKSVRSLASLIDNIGNQIYFASGTFDGKKQGGAGGEGPLTPEKRKRFYLEAGPILDELADVGFPSVAHHLLETLGAFIPLDPRGVFLRIGQVVRGGRKGGYQYESLAADLMVTLVERYLAEYRVLLRENDDCQRTLLEVLDIFVQAGWPSARRLTYRLEEIFR